MVDLLLMLIVLLGLAALGTSRLDGYIKLTAVQGVLLGAVLLAGDVSNISPRVLWLAASITLLKGLVLPWLLQWSMREAHIRREVEPYIGFSLSLMLGLGAIGLAFAIANRLPLVGLSEASRLVVPAALATLFMGFMLVITRKKAISQVLGYLMMENGIFLFGLALREEMPVIVEMGVLLDVFVGVFIMGITLFQINRAFDDLNVTNLESLTDMGQRSTRNGNGESLRVSTALKREEP